MELFPKQWLQIWLNTDIVTDLRQECTSNVCDRLATADICKLLTLVIYSLHIFNTFRKARLFMPSNFCKTDYSNLYNQFY